MKKYLLFLFLALPLCAHAQVNYARMLSGVDTHTTPTYTFVATDTTKLVDFKSASAIAATMPPGSTQGFQAGAIFSVHNSGVGLVTITCSGCTISGLPQGQTVLNLSQNQGADIYSDGLNYTLQAGNAPIVNYYLNSANGTICNELVKLDSSGPGFNGKAVVTAGAETQGVIGVALWGCGTTGTAGVASSGQVLIVFDGATVTVGDYVGISNTSGLVTDVGASPGAGQTIGQVILSPAGVLPSGCTVAPGCYVQLFLGSSGGSGGGNPNALVNNPSSVATNTVVPTVTGFAPLRPKCPGGAASTDLCFDVQDNAGNHILQAQQNGLVKIGSGSTKSLSSGVSSNTDFDGELTNSGGASTYTFTGTYASHPICTANDLTSIAAVKVTYTGTTSVTFTTAGATDVVEYHCLGRN